MEAKKMNDGKMKRKINFDCLVKENKRERKMKRKGNAPANFFLRE